MKRLLPLSVLLACLLFAAASSFASDSAGSVKLMRTPDGGLQPQALVDAKGTVHLVYLKGDPKACDVIYARRATAQTNFSATLRVNSDPGSAIAVGTIRGAQMALGREGRVHVAWNGNGGKKSERGAPMLYSRLNDAGDAFEPQRDMMASTMHLDGGGSVAADSAGHVYVVWHAAPVEGPKGEQNRGVYMVKSADDGKTFAEERKIKSDHNRRVRLLRIEGVCRRARPVERPVPRGGRRNGSRRHPLAVEGRGKNISAPGVGSMARADLPDEQHDARQFGLRFPGGDVGNSRPSAPVEYRL